jgi:polysaccharide biosynthesis protein PslH
MRILQICNKVPFPPKDGGCIAMNNLTMGLLEEGHQVKVLAINTPKHFVKVENLPSDYKTKTNIEAVFIDTNVKMIPAVLNLFSGDSYNTSRFYSTAFEKKILKILSSETYDIILLESIFVSMYIPAIRKSSKAKVVLRAHNIEHKLWERNAAVSSSLLKRTYFKFLAKRLKKYEEATLASYDAVAAITKEDANWFLDQKFDKPVKIISFGIDLDKFVLKEKINTEHPSVFHIGAMDWQPNIEGVHWFLDTVWDKVNQLYPQLKLYIAGRKMPEDLLRLNKSNVIVAGEVEDAALFMKSKGLMIVPLFSGGGMRVKIIEGMVLEKTIVTTTLGIEGINYKNGENIIIANTPEEFISAISKYILSHDHLDFIGKNAKLVASEHYNNKDICKKLSALFDSISTTV